MKVIKYRISIVLLFVLGFYFYKDFFNYSFSLLDTGNFIMASRTMSGGFYRSLLFPTVLGILPLLYLLVQKATKIKFLYNGLIACGIILVFGF